MEDLHSAVDQIFTRVSHSLKSRKGTEIAESLHEIVDDLAGQVATHPVQTLCVGVALGYVFAKALRGGGGSIAPRLIAKGLGSVAAIGFLEYISRKAPHAPQRQRAEYQH